MKNLLIFLYISFIRFCLLVGIIAFYLSFATEGPMGNAELSGETVIIFGFLLRIPMGGCAINAWNEVQSEPPSSPYGNFQSYAAYRRNVHRIRSERRQVLYMKNLITFRFMSFVCFCLLAGIVAFYFATKDPRGNDMLSGETVLIVGILLMIRWAGAPSTPGNRSEN
ncbi:hypothetical protein RUND412_005126 [Rhizina undulata]